MVAGFERLANEIESKVSSINPVVGLVTTVLVSGKDEEANQVLTKKRKLVSLLAPNGETVREMGKQVTDEDRILDEARRTEVA